MDAPQLPFLPGNTFRNARSHNFKKQSLKYHNGYSIVDYPPAERDHESHFPDQEREEFGMTNTASRPVSAMSGVSMSMSMPRPTSTTYGAQRPSTGASDTLNTSGGLNLSSTRDITQHLSRCNLETGDLDHKCLCFDGYFVEDIFDSALEKQRVRFVKIKFFPADGTIQILEEKQENSGLWQGSVLRRCKVAKDDGEFLDVDDFHVGESLHLYGREYCIFDADRFTRKFMEETYGIEVPARVDPPADFYSTKKKKEKEVVKNKKNDILRWVEGMLGKASHLLRDEDMSDFVKYDGVVLRFGVAFNDTDGKVVKFVLMYFLQDHTIQINELMVANSGKDPFPVFLRRQRVPKNFNGLEDIQLGDVYKPVDFHVGEEINVFGRHMLIYDCDGFTRDYYKTKFGRDFSRIELPSDKPPKKYEHVPPPHSGVGLSFGSPVDTLQNCLQLIPRPPRRDLVKLAEKDRKILRFKMTLNEKSQRTADDVERRFVLNYFLQDDTFSIFEEERKNSGRMEGTFLRRQRVRKAIDPAHPEGGQHFEPQDFFIGADVCILKHWFDVVDADEYTLVYMEGHPEEFSCANIVQVLMHTAQSLSSANVSLEDMFAGDVNASGKVSGDRFRAVMQSLKLGLSAHEVITLDRFYDRDDSGFFILKDFLDNVQTASGAGDVGTTGADEIRTAFLGRISRQLRDVLFAKRSLFEQTVHEDYDERATGTVTCEELTYALNRYNIQLRQSEVVTMCEYLFGENVDTVDYRKLLDALREFSTH